MASSVGLTRTNGWWAALLLSAVLGCANPPDREAAPNPTRPPEPIEQGPGADLRRVLNEHRVPLVKADGTPAGPPLTPLQASAAFGGIVMLVGGLGAVWLWRRADVTVPDEPEGVVRNSAAPPGTFR